MAESKVAEALQPMMTRTVAVFTGTMSTVSERMQPALGRTSAGFQEAGHLVGAFLTPAAVVALSFGLWRLGADLGWTGEFPVSTGAFAHWMVWIALAIGLKMTGSLMNRPGPKESQEGQKSSSNSTPGPAPRVARR